MVIDGGGSLQARGKAVTSVDREQRWKRARLLLESFAEADGIALNGGDWAAAPSSLQLRQAVAEWGVPVLAANLVCDGSAPFPGHRVVTRQGRRIALVGVTEGPVEGCEVSAPGPALAAAVASAGEVDAVVALVPLTAQAAVAEAVGDLADVVVDATGRYAASGPKGMGHGWAIGAGTRGKHVGRAELVFVPGGEGFRPMVDPTQGAQQVERLEKRLASVEQRLAKGDPNEGRMKALRDQRARVEADLVAARAAQAPGDGAHHQLRLSEVALSRDVADHPAMLGKVEALADEQVAVAVQRRTQRVVTDRTSAYAGADACASCHPAQTTQWLTTPHAKAYDTLALGGDAADASCVPCHVTGFQGSGEGADFRPHAFARGVDGPKTPAEVGGARDVQCEACHGPSRAHTAAAGDPAHYPLKTPDTGVCQQCHDNERDDHEFDIGTYLPKVVHGAPSP